MAVTGGVNLDIVATICHPKMIKSVYNCSNASYFRGVKRRAAEGGTGNPWSGTCVGGSRFRKDPCPYPPHSLPYRARHCPPPADPCRNVYQQGSSRDAASDGKTLGLPCKYPSF